MYSRRAALGLAAISVALFSLVGLAVAPTVGLSAPGRALGSASSTLTSSSLELRTGGGPAALTTSGGATQFAPPFASTKVSTLCSSVPGPGLGYSGGVWPAPSGNAYVEDWYNGALVLCGHGSSSTIAAAPPGFSTDDYFGMTGVRTSSGLDLLLLSFASPARGWVCVTASVSGCASQTNFTLPSKFCSSEPAGVCNPDGVIATPKLGFTYVDAKNKQMVTCTAGARSCTVDAASSAFSGFRPVGIVQNGSTLYVSDASCSGNVWSGSRANMSVLYTVGDKLQGVAFDHGDLYVADTGNCTGAAAHIVDLTTGTSLTSPFTGPNSIPGLDSKLQFSSWAGGAVYQE